MKKLLFSILAVVLLTTLISCKPRKHDQEKNESTNEESTNEIKDYIFTKDTKLKIVYDEASDNTGRVVHYLFDVFGNFPPRGVYTEIPKGEHEILIGHTDRELSDSAYKALERLERLLPIIIYTSIESRFIPASLYSYYVYNFLLVENFFLPFVYQILAFYKAQCRFLSFLKHSVTQSVT